jgi:hypothetical protein
MGCLFGAAAKYRKRFQNYSQSKKWGECSLTARREKYHLQALSDFMKCAAKQLFL